MECALDTSNDTSFRMDHVSASNDHITFVSMDSLTDKRDPNALHMNHSECTNTAILVNGDIVRRSTIENTNDTLSTAHKYDGFMFFGDIIPFGMSLTFTVHGHIVRVKKWVNTIKRVVA